MILTSIIEEKKKEVEAAKKKIPQKDIIERIRNRQIPPKPHFFKHSLAGHNHVHLIAEVKKASPIAGVLRKDFDPLKIALTYEASGASAISVLTDEKFFQGQISYLEKIKKSVNIPVMRKDFIIDEYQIYESILSGADATLLIADLLTEAEIRAFIAVGRENKFDFLTEVHTEEDLDKALAAGCDIIGINNRDLHSFKIDIHTTTRLVKLIPREKIIVSESGIRTRENILYLRSLGVNAVLMGEVFMRSDDIGRTIGELMR